MEFSIDLVEEILLNLPVKSLSRFKQVSKSWRELISHSRFIKRHLHRAKQQLVRQNFIAYSPFYPRRFDTTMIETRRDDDHLSSSSFHHIASLRPPRSAPEVHVTGNCDGLLCVKTSGPFFGVAASFYLWNPSIRDFKTLPLPSCPENNTNYIDKPYWWVRETYTCGIGHNPKADDYYICKIPSWGSRPVLPLNCPKELYPDQVQILYLKSNSWRKITYNDMIFYGRRLQDPYITCVNGNLYMVAISESNNRPVLICFDAADETFRELAMPPHDQKVQEGEEEEDDAIWDYYSTTQILCVNYEETLCLIKECPDNFFFWEYEETTSTWVKFHNISMIPRLCWSRLLFRTRDHLYLSLDELRGQTEVERKFIKYSFASKEMNEENPFGERKANFDSRRFVNVYPLYETLVSPTSLICDN